MDTWQHRRAVGGHGGLHSDLQPGQRHDRGRNVVVAGAPARVKEGLSFYRDISLDEKFALLARWLSQAPFALSDDAALTVEVDVEQLFMP